MDAHSDATDATDATDRALARAVADELHDGARAAETLSMPELVLRCDAAGVSASDVLRRALDRVMHKNDDESTI